MSFVIPSFQGFIKPASTLWTPAQLDNIIGGYISVASGGSFQGIESSGNISQWNDIYGTNHITQSSGTYQANWDSVNEKVTFTGGSLVSYGDYFDIGTSSVKTIALVYANISGADKVNSVASGATNLIGELFLGGSSGIGANSISFDNAGTAQGKYAIAGDAWSSNAENHTTSDYHSNNFGLFEWVNNQNIVYIGRRGGENNFGYGGDMYYLLLLGDSLTSTEKEKLEGWTAHTFGYTAQLPAEHPYIASPPTV